MEAIEKERPTVAVIYHMFPHYRAPVMRALAASEKYKFEFWGSHEPVRGIPAFRGDEQVRVNSIFFRHVGASAGYFRGMFSPILRSDVKAVVILGNPNFAQTWLAACLARVLSKKVFFWSHGWLKREGFAKRVFRNIYFSLANAVLVYGERARKVAASSGYEKGNIKPIFNSLDWNVSKPLFDQLCAIDAGDLRRGLGLGEGPVVVCTARLTEICRFDLLLDAAALMRAAGEPVQIVLIGDGPCRGQLEGQASKLGLNVRFTGAIYEEKILSQYLFVADATVSPGKVGLTAIHSLSYGTPVVTHSDFDSQMPEVEAVIEGVSGAFFKKNDVDDLVRAMRSVFSDARSRDDVRKACHRIVEEKYTPGVQRELIEGALDEAFRR